MSVRTPHYNLEAFSWGDTYSASVDRRRFIAIDTQLAFLSDRVGNGRINGWDIIEKTGAIRGITILPGMGIINRRVLRSFGYLDVTVQDNSKSYIYMKALTGEIGGVSGFTDIIGITCVDTTSPAQPTGLRDNTSLKSYNQIGLSWNENTEVDFSHYSIRRIDETIYTAPSVITSPSVVSYKEIAQTTETTYIDTNLEQNMEYGYEVVAVDYSGNESEGAEIYIRTKLDTRIPLNPLFVQVFPGNETIQVIWDNSPSDNVTNYKVQVNLYNSPYTLVDETTVVANSLIEFDSTYAFFEDLKNNIIYKVTVYAININNYSSDGIFTTVKPSDFVGSGEVSFTSSDVEIERSKVANVGLEANLSWLYVENPYLPFPEEFLITFIENGTRISDTISRLESSVRTQCSGGDPLQNCYSTNIKFIPFKDENGQVYYESIKEYTPYLIMIQTVDSDDNKSNGVIIRINRTKTYADLPAVINVSIERQADNSVYISWENPSWISFSHIIVTCTLTDLS